VPTYAYRCTACGHAFDIQQAFSDDALTVCPECGGALRKLFSPVGVTFSGSGFYRTDSRAAAGGGSGSAGGSGGGGASGGSGGGASGGSGSSSGSGASSGSSSSGGSGSSGGSSATAAS